MMSRIKRLDFQLFTNVLVIAIAGVAPQPVRADSPPSDAVLRTLRAMDRRVADIGYRLTTAAAPLCPGGFAAPFSVQSSSQYALAYRPGAARLLGVGNAPSVGIVSPGSAAERAGLREGVVIASIDGETFAATSPDKRATFAVVKHLEDVVDRLAADGALTIVIGSGGGQSKLSLNPDPGCPTRFDVRAGGATDASANGRYVQVGSDLVQSLAADEDLAALLAHEIAHNILAHPQLLDRVGGGLLPGFGKSGRTIRATETAADRLSLYILALAGYDLPRAIAFWDRFTRANSWGIFSDRTHPSATARVTSLQAEAARIAELRAAGAPIMPPADLLRSTGTSDDRPPAR